MKNKNWVLAVFILPAVLSFLLVFLYPTIRTFIMSFFYVQTVTDSMAEWEFVGIANYMKLLGSTMFRQSLKNIFVRDAFGIDLGLLTSIGRDASLNARIQPQLNRLDAAEVILCATFLACAPDDIDVLQGTNWLSPVAVSFNQQCPA